MPAASSPDTAFMRLALKLAARGYGTTSPNPMVGAVLVSRGQIIGRGWHHYAGGPHAEIEALRDAEKRGCSARGATIYVTLEPCSTQGRTPPCTTGLIRAGVKRVVVGAIDPNPHHSGKGLALLRRAGIAVSHGVLEPECRQLNEAFNHWITRRAPLVCVKAALTMDGKIALRSGESKWLTSERARAYAMRLRQGADALLVGVNTILADDPSLTFRSAARRAGMHRLRRIVLDSNARTPLAAKVISDQHSSLTTIVVGKAADRRRVAELASRVRILTAPYETRARRAAGDGATRLDLRWLLRRLGSEEVTSLLVEGGGEVNSSFLVQGLAQRIAFFYAPKLLGGRDSRKAVAGAGVSKVQDGLKLADVSWRRLGPDLLLTARI